MKRIDDIKYITDVNYFIGLLEALYNKYINSWKPKEGEFKYVLKFYNDGQNIGSKRTMCAFYTPCNCEGKFVFENDNDMEYFYNRYYNLFNIIKKMGGCI